MKRRDYIKTIMLGSALPMLHSSYGYTNAITNFFEGPLDVNFKSDWQNWADMKWAGPEYWGNRLQDWKIEDGRLICDITGNYRTLHLLTLQNSEGNIPLEISVKIRRLSDDLKNFEGGSAGLLIGAKGNFEDYRSAAVFGKGLIIGLTPAGKLKVGEEEFETGLQGMPEDFQIRFSSKPNGNDALAEVEILDDEEHSIIKKDNLKFSAEELTGNFALISDFGKKVNDSVEEASVSFSDWSIRSPRLFTKEDNLFGPICFAQYTLHNKKLKLTGQFAPIEEIKDHKVKLQFQKDGKWITNSETQVEHAGRAVNFQVSEWNETKDIPYRILAEIPVGNKLHQYIYEGTIAAEPSAKKDLNVAVFSCNAHYGFPDQDIPDSLIKLDYDMSLFLGDQFYESTGGYGVSYTGDFDKTCLDYLRKWMMFGWSYRDIFRHKPCAIIPDDHDVYHGNVWGEGGKKADVSSGYSSAAQDTGGYKMETDWVNMVQFTQTSHLPDAYDPTPVKNGIGVYYTNWNYGGVSFAIIEDRKFKSAPLQVLPKEAEVFNGFIRNTQFDIKKHKDIDAELLGDRQEKFLEEWAQDWPEGIHMKVLCSQTNFATVATLPKGETSDRIVPSLRIPEKGEYIKGDAPTVDMDSNGWPQKKRDKAVEIIRKGFAFHIAGDQHLGSFVQYGVDQHGDAGYAFAGPALNNLWPRRFWPPVDASNHTYENPAYTGDFEDGFGNKITVKAVANPFNAHKEPQILYNRANGFGLVSLDKKARTIQTSCYQRFKEVTSEDAQYPGWPITVSQEEQLLSHAKYKLPEIQLDSDKQVAIRVLDKNEQLIYSLPLPSKRFTPRVFSEGKYKLEFMVNNKKVSEENVKTLKKKAKSLSVKV